MLLRILIYQMVGLSMRQLLNVLAMTWLMGALAHAGDPNSPHPHQGKLAGWTGAPPTITLSADELTRLDQGSRIERHKKTSDGGSGIAVQYIEASPEIIWQTILSYHRYKDWVKNVDSCTVYQREGNDLYVDMQISVLGFKSGIYTKNTVRKDLGYMTWTLDYSRKSDVNDLVGYWRVTPLEGWPGWSRLEYATEMVMSGVPGFIVRYMTKDALAEGTAWVKLRAEAAQR